MLTLTIISSISFIIYGVLILSTGHMAHEFERYNLSKYRKLTGILEVLGGLGLLIGLQFNLLFQFSSAGLTLLMLMGTATRIKVKDPFIEIIPAFFLMSINGYLFYQSIKYIF